MKQIGTLVLYLLLAQVIYSQSMESSTPQLGSRPYEMLSYTKEAIIDFTDCSKWEIETKNSKAELYRTDEQIVTESYSGKIVYETAQKEAAFFVKLKKPISLQKEWDCLDVWTYGDHWLWGEPYSRTSMQIYAVFMGEDDVHEVNMVQSGYSQLAHKYWFLNHLKLGIGKKYISFLGFKFKGNDTDVGVTHTIYLSSVYMYREELLPLTFKKFPEKLPFPCRKETILPINKSATYTNEVNMHADSCFFFYKGDDDTISYRIGTHNLLGDIVVTYNRQKQQIVQERKMILFDGTVAQLYTTSKRIYNDTLFAKSIVRIGKKKLFYNIWYTIRQKSLICGINELQKDGSVAELYAGIIKYDEGKSIPIPFLRYNNADRPHLLSCNHVFYYLMFDWYKTNASSMSASGMRQNQFTGGKVLYTPKTNGKRNPLNEVLFINVSSDVQEILPTIDNPASPMRTLQADRLWAINGGSDLSKLSDYVVGLRTKGVEKVSVRYHEDFWRKGGESYTFRLSPNPDLGVDRIRKFIRFVKSNDWRVGLYTNYTDMAPVNSLWNPDWMKRGPNGEWEVSWSRCYAPKPQIAWEQEAILAPQIYRLFNTNHSYCDVHTAISPISRVDYDFRVPEAGMMKGVIKRYGMLLMNERIAYNGPVYSEGGNHWWYAGLVDGNYANDDLMHLPVFPDFNLLKIHPLEMDAANTGTGYQYICYALAYGNIGILSEGNDAVMRYAFLQPIQNDYVMIPIKSIHYCSEGKLYQTSDAIRKELIEKPQLRIEYESGLQTYINFGVENWIVPLAGTTYTLPPFGFIAYMPSTGVISSSTLSIQSDERCDEVFSKDVYYLNTHGKEIEGKLGGNGNYLIKKEKFGWEIIPLQDNTKIRFDLSLVGLNNHKVKLVALTQDGDCISDAYQLFENYIDFIHNKSIYKYQLIPAI